MHAGLGRDKNTSSGNLRRLAEVGASSSATGSSSKQSGNEQAEKQFEDLVRIVFPNAAETSVNTDITVTGLHGLSEVLMSWKMVLKKKPNKWRSKGLL